MLVCEGSKLEEMQQGLEWHLEMRLRNLRIGVGVDFVLEFEVANMAHLHVLSIWNLCKLFGRLLRNINLIHLI